MKIAIINGQNHKGSTYHIGQLLVENIAGENEISEFFLPRDLNHFCLGCYTCLEDETRCPYYNEKWAIMQKIEEADLLIFTTPNYCFAPSAPLKAFIDMTFTYWSSHKPRGCMFSKRAVVISTTAGAGTKAAMKPVSRMLFYWGVPSVKEYGIGVQAKSWDGVSEKKKAKITKDIKKLAKSLSTDKTPHVSIKTKMMFTMMQKIQKGNMGSGPIEHKYWEDLGWLGKERPWKKQQKKK